MRNSPTESESLLWLALRRKALGVRVRRQLVLGPYVVDFFIPAAMLAIEVDGGSHAGRERDDARRDRWLAANGVRVLRVRADDVMGDLAGVVARVLGAVQQ